MARYAICCLASLLAGGLAAPRDVAAQNLVTNGQFASDLSGWQFPDATPTWAAYDVAGSASSGSAYFVNTQAASGVTLSVLEQCIPVTQTGAYVFGVSAFTPTGQASAGALLGNYSVDLHHVDCSGGCSTLGGFEIPGLGAWAAYATTTSFNPPLLVQSLNPDASIAVELLVQKTPAGGSFGGYFDAVYLIRDTLFMSGFE